jgi:zinc transport system permease protein
MLEALQFEFMRNAVLAGFIAALACGIIGTLVVVNRLVFMSGGIAHAAYGGIGMAFYFNIPYLLGTIGFSVLVALIMAMVTLKSKHRSDTVIGALWAVGMGIGIILLDMTPGYHVDLMSYLFGSILTVPNEDLVKMMVICGLVFLTTGFFYHDFLAMSYDDEFARLRGVPVNFVYCLLLVMIALSVVVIIRIVGLILIIALLTIPPYMAEQYVRSLKMMMLVSALLSIGFTFMGLWLSYRFNLTSGATIILVAASAFLLSMAVRRIKNQLKSAGGKGSNIR